MARAARILLDAALISLKTVNPVIGKLYYSAKNYLVTTSARSIVDNDKMHKFECKMAELSHLAVSKLEFYRDKQLPAEIEYLENELKKSKQKLKIKEEEKEHERRSPSHDSTSAGKTLRPRMATAWKYLKVESVPPLTESLFNGPVGRKIENVVGGTFDGILKTIETVIKQMDADVVRAKLEREAKIKHEKEKRKAEELKKRIADAKKAMEARKAKEKEARARAVEAAAKAAKAAEAAKKDDEKKKPDTAKKLKKKKRATRRDPRKGPKKPPRKAPRKK